MALEFGNQLFRQGALQQDTGVLPPRYLQEGSKVINVFGGRGLLYVNTPGKKLYITSMQLHHSAATFADVIDDGVFGTVKVQVAVLTTSLQVQLNFSTPLEFLVNVYINCAEADLTVSFQGWEE